MIVIKFRDIVYDKKLLQQLYLKKQLYGLYMNKKTAVLVHLNFFNKVINKLLAVDVKINEKKKALILFSSLLESCDHITTTMLYGKKTLILEAVMSILLYNEIRKRPNQEEQTGSSLVIMKRKGRREKKKGLDLLKACHLCHRKDH